MAGKHLLSLVEIIESKLGCWLRRKTSMMGVILIGDDEAAMRSDGFPVF